VAPDDGVGPVAFEGDAGGSETVAWVVAGDDGADAAGDWNILRMSALLIADFAATAGFAAAAAALVTEAVVGTGGVVVVGVDGLDDVAAALPFV
jgi:hypothetical protein